MTKSIPEAPDRAWLDVDLGALVRNARTFQDLIETPLLPMVKADGYGLGAVAVARALERVEPWGYGVATVAEGAELRAAGLDRPIVVFTPLAPDLALVTAMRAHQLRPVIGDIEALDAWRSAGGGPFQVEIDTGMSRAGFRWHDEAGLTALRGRLANHDGWEGIFTHFHSADTDRGATRLQAERFEAVLACLGERPPLVHLANSAAAGLPDDLGGDLARPGIFLYGGRAGSLKPEPVARLRARVVALRRLRPGDTVSYGAEWRAERETTIATIGIGYGDGVPRALGGGALVELNGDGVRIVGRVTMDMLMVDVEARPVRVGDVATIFGGRFDLDTMAVLAGTIPYELLTRIAPRVPRRYGTTP